MKKVIITLLSVLLFIDACSTLKLADQLNEEKVEMELSRERLSLRSSNQHVLVVPQLKKQGLLGPQKNLVITYSGTTDNGLVVISRFRDPEVVLNSQPVAKKTEHANARIVEYVE
jgi:hypothetical protein